MTKEMGAPSGTEREPVPARLPEYQYLDLLRDILQNGHDKPSLGGRVELRGVFGRQHRWDLSDGTIPILTTKQVAWRTAFREMLWFISGDSNIKTLVDQNIHIWDDWPFREYKHAVDKGEVPELSQDDFIQKIKEEDRDSEFVQHWGELGPVYGSQWRHWKTSDGREIDQLAWLIDKIRRTPTRKHAVVSAWNPEFVYEMASPSAKMMDLPPCHMIFQVDVEGNRLSLQMFQRSCDIFLGVPFNIAQYALLTRILAHVTKLEPGELIHTFGNAHIYEIHFEQVQEQLTREPRPFPKLSLNPDVRDIDKLTINDIKVEGYDPHPPIKGDVVVVGGMF